MRPSEIAARMTGFSTPFFGLSWNPPTADREVARRVLAFLEDRRVLYSPYEVELADQCVMSVIDIRRFLTDVIGHGGVADELAIALRAMRGACRQFLSELQIAVDDGNALVDTLGHFPRGYQNGLQDFMLNQALGRLRGVFGMYVAQVAVAYDIDIEDGLASILPAGAE